MKTLPGRLATARAALAVFFALLLAVGAAGARQGVYELSEDSQLDVYSHSLVGPWEYRRGDDEAGRWQPWPAGAPADLAPELVQEVIWFRMRLRAVGEATGKSYQLWVASSGPFEAFLDGVRVGALGSVDAAQAGGPTAISLQPTFHALPVLGSAEHSLAIRYVSPTARRAVRQGLAGGFQVGVADDAAAADYHASVDGLTARTYAGAGAGLALAFLHLMLFAFHRKEVANAYYALTATSVACIALFAHAANATTSPSALYFFAAFKACVVTACLIGLRFFYCVFEPKLPRTFWAFAVVGVPMALASYYLSYAPMFIFGMIAFAEQLRVIVKWNLRRADGAWILGIAGAGPAVLSSVDMLASLGVFGEVQTPGLYIVGFFVMLLSMSVYLARDFAKTRMRLEEQLGEVERLSELRLQEALARERLEAENQRKELELEGARKREVVLRELEIAHENLRATQSQLVQSEKMASLGQLVAGIAHEINTPIGAIASMHDSLRRATQKLGQALEQSEPDVQGQDGQVQTALKVIGDATRIIGSGSQRVSEIVRRLKSFARLDQAALQSAQLNDGLDDALSLVGHQLEGRIRVEKRYGDIPSIACYASQLNQVFLNLLVNAIQAVEGREDPRIGLASSLQGDEVLVTIEDNGVGIAPGDLGRIFDPGFTTKGVGVGTGLGLSICYQIVKDHGGRILVESELGKGTKVIVVIPANPEPRAAARRAP